MRRTTSYRNGDARALAAGDRQTAGGGVARTRARPGAGNPTVRRPRKPRPARSNKQPPVAVRSASIREPAMCERCGALYQHRVWRARGPLPFPKGMTWTVCPACEQRESHEYFGRVVLSGPFVAAHRDEIERRIRNVEKRAAFTQPERRLVDLNRERDGLEVLTTSQKLAHRIGRELEKAFGGAAHFHWSESDGALEVRWSHETSAPR